MFKWLIGRRGFLAGVAVFLANPFRILSDKEEDNLIRSLFVNNGVTNVDYITIWNRFTHETSLTLQYMLPMQLKKRDEQGNLVFTTHDPGILPYRGTIHCYVCRKSNIPDENNLVLHMQSKHRLEWESYRHIHYAGYIEEV